MGARLLSGGYGRYDNWGLRAAMTPPAGSKTPAEVKLDLGNGVSMEFVYIKPGSFTMGGENTKGGRFDCVEVPKHQVTLTKGFYLGKYEVTEGQWQAVMGEGVSGSPLPVRNVTWFEVTEFLHKLNTWLFANARDSLPTNQNHPCFVRLPTEVEWEFAARGGTARGRTGLW